MWSVIIGPNIIGPFIIGGLLDEVTYHNMLINRITPAVWNVEGLNFQFSLVPNKIERLLVIQEMCALFWTAVSQDSG